MDNATQFPDIINEGVKEGLQQLTASLPIPIALRVVLVIQEVATRILHFIGLIDDDSLEEIHTSKTEFFGKHANSLWGDRITISKGDSGKEYNKKIINKTILITLQLLSLIAMHQVLGILNPPPTQNTIILRASDQDFFNAGFN